MDSDPGDTNDNKLVPVLEDAGPELQGDELDVHHEERDDVSLEEVLYQYRAVILDLDQRVRALEQRPQFASSVRSRRTGH